jgi:hypothetical protein
MEAARCGHVDLLRWLMDNGCPWDGCGLCWAAVQGGCVEVLEHLQEQGFQANADLLKRLLRSAGYSGHLPVAKWLRQQGADWPATVNSFWCAEVLAWARAEGCTSPLTD